MSKFMEANEKIAEAVVEGYKKIEDGETVEEAKERLNSYAKKEESEEN